MNLCRALALVLAVPGFSFASVAAESGSSETVNFSGDWNGTGQLIGTNGSKTACSKIRIKIDHQVSTNPQLLTVKVYDATCGYFGPEWGPYPFEIRDGKVFEDGEETGTLEGNLFKSLQASGGVQYAFNMKLVAGVQPSDDVLRSYYGVRNGLGAMVIEGDLKRAQHSPEY
jgi:hypothetical protein